MFCVECGYKIPDGSRFCAQCGHAIDNTNSISKPVAKERIIKEGLCNCVKSALNVQNGHGLLTNKRFIYSKHGFAKIVLMGVFVNLTKGDYDFEIPIENISRIKEGRQGFSKTIILETKFGEEYNFYFTDRLKWMIEFQNLIK